MWEWMIPKINNVRDHVLLGWRMHVFSRRWNISGTYLTAYGTQQKLTYKSICDAVKNIF